MRDTDSKRVFFQCSFIIWKSLKNSLLDTGTVDGFRTEVRKWAQPVFVRKFAVKQFFKGHPFGRSVAGYANLLVHQPSGCPPPGGARCSRTPASGPRAWRRPWRATSWGAPSVITPRAGFRRADASAEGPPVRRQASRATSTTAAASRAWWTPKGDPGASMGYSTPSPKRRLSSPTTPWTLAVQLCARVTWVRETRALSGWMRTLALQPRLLVRRTDLSRWAATQTWTCPITHPSTRDGATQKRGPLSGGASTKWRQWWETSF